MLPGDLSGRAIALEIIAERASLPVVYMSGFADHGEEHPYLTARNFLRKPFSPDALREMISEALA